MKLRKTRCSEGSGRIIGVAESPRKSLVKQLALLDMNNEKPGLINVGYGPNDSPVETNLP